MSISNKILEEKELHITGAWTKAGVASCVHVQGGNKLDDFLFDCGYLPSEVLTAKYVFISHGHIDHIGCCISLARAKTLSGSKTVFYVPVEIVEHLQEAHAAFEKLDNSPILMNIVGLRPGDVHSVGSHFTMRVFQTEHRVPSLGYALFAQQKGGLRPEYHNLSNAEIRELVGMGHTIRMPDTEHMEMVCLPSIHKDTWWISCSIILLVYAVSVCIFRYLGVHRRYDVQRISARQRRLPTDLRLRQPAADPYPDHRSHVPRRRGEQGGGQRARAPAGHRRARRVIRACAGTRAGASLAEILLEVRFSTCTTAPQLY
jgi:hypothetical protein